jgi:hypothetical protein
MRYGSWNQAAKAPSTKFPDPLLAQTSHGDITPLPHLFDYKIMHVKELLS